MHQLPWVHSSPEFGHLSSEVPPQHEQTGASERESRQIHSASLIIDSSRKSSSKSEVLGNHNIRASVENQHSFGKILHDWISEDAVGTKDAYCVEFGLGESNEVGFSVDEAMWMHQEEHDLMNITVTYRNHSFKGYSQAPFDVNSSGRMILNQEETTEPTDYNGTKPMYKSPLKDVGAYLTLYWVPIRVDNKCGKPLITICSTPISYLLISALRTRLFFQRQVVIGYRVVVQSPTDGLNKAGIYYGIQVLQTKGMLQKYEKGEIEGNSDKGEGKSIVSNVVLGIESAFMVPTYDLKTATEIPLYLILGMLCRVVSVVMSRLVAWFNKIFEVIQERFGLPTMVCHVGTGTIALKYPGILYWGFTKVEEILHTRKSASAPRIWLLTQLACVKVIATTLCKGSGLVGVLYAPSLMIVAAVGAIVGSFAAEIINSAIPGNAVVAQPQAYALVGMDATLTPVCSAPLTSVLLLFELTKDYRILADRKSKCNGRTMIEWLIPWKAQTTEEATWEEADWRQLLKNRFHFSALRTRQNLKEAVLIGSRPKCTKAHLESP